MPMGSWVLEPPPSPRPADGWHLDILLMNACIRHGVRFHRTPGILLLPLGDIETVLNALPAHIRILGFDGFRLEGYRVYPRSDYMADYGDGLGVAKALAVIADWPRDLELWIEAVLIDDRSA